GNTHGILGPTEPHKAKSSPSAQYGGQVNQKGRKIHRMACRDKNSLFLRKVFKGRWQKISRCWPRPSTVLNPFWPGNSEIWEPGMWRKESETSASKGTWAFCTRPIYACARH